MPELPKLLADWFSAPFRRPVEVRAVHSIAKDLIRVQFSGKSLVGVKCRAGQEVEFRVSDTSFRHYTPSFFDAEQGHMEVVFFLHDQGPGSLWARELKKGDLVHVMGPGGTFKLASSGAHVLVGDETVLGLAEHLQRAFGATLRIGIELDAERLSWPQALGLQKVEAIERQAFRGAALAQFATNHYQAHGSSEVHYYLVGHAQSIIQMRKALLTVGCTKKMIHSKAYWADGKRGL